MIRIKYDDVNERKKENNYLKNYFTVLDMFVFTQSNEICL